MAKNLKFNIFRPLLAILLVFIPLYPKFPLFNLESTYVAIRLDDIVIALGLLALLIHQVRNKFSLFKLKITKLFLIYFFAVSLSFLNALLIIKTEPASILLLHALRKLEYMSVIYIAYLAISTKKELKYPLIFICLASIFIAIYGYGQKYHGFPIISTMNEEFSKGYLLTLTSWSRISSTFAGHYDFAAFLSVFMVVLAGSLVIIQNRLKKFILVILWLFLFDLLTLTASRVSIFALWGGLLVCFILIKKYLWIIPASAIIFLGISSSGELNQRLIATINTLPAININFQKSKPKPVTIPTPTPTPKIITQIPTPFIGGTTKPKSTPTPTPTIIRNRPDDYPEVDIDAGVSRSGEIRFNVEWPRAINAFKRNVLLGTGLGSLGLATDNDILRLLGESGLLGFISFSAIFMYFLLKTIKSPTRLNLVFLATVLTFLANAVFIDVFAASKTAYLFWLMMGIYLKNLEFKND